MEQARVIEFSDESRHDLELCFAGISQCEPQHSYGPAVRPNYLIHIVLKGKGQFRSGNASYALEAGQGFLIQPDKVTYYIADREDPWEYCWVGFRGNRVEELLRELDLGDEHPVFACEQTGALKSLILDLMNIQGSHLAQRLHRDAMIMEFFSILASQLHVASSARDQERNEYIRQAITYIQGNYDQPVKVSDIAAHIGIERSYLYLLFVEHLGITPKNYLTTYRLTRARELLKVTDLPIASIAESCGYSDALVFSKAFRQMYQMTPTAWRKTRNQLHPNHKKKQTA